MSKSSKRTKPREWWIVEGDNNSYASGDARAYRTRREAEYQWPLATALNPPVHVREVLPPRRTKKRKIL